MTNLVTIKQELDEMCKAYNLAVLDNDYEKIHNLDTEMTDKVGEYTAIARNACFAECKADADPMMAAIKKMTFETITIKDTKEGELKIPRRSIEPKDMTINLLKLHEYCDGIGHNKQWVYTAEQFNFLMTALVASDIGLDPKSINDSYAMNRISRDIIISKDPNSNTSNPISNSNLLESLRSVIAQMIGDEWSGKVLSHDVNFLKWTYGKKGKSALTVMCANHKTMRELLMNICHRVVMNERYSVDYKRIKK